MTKRSLKETWVLLRLNLREMARDHAENYLRMVNALPVEPVEPDRIASLVNSLSSNVERMATEKEKSPILRTLKRCLFPDDAQKALKRLGHSFVAYQRAWSEGQTDKA